MMLRVVSISRWMEFSRGFCPVGLRVASAKSLLRSVTTSLPVHPMKKMSRCV